METPASIHKHPIHPMLITLPIGLWVFSLVSDIIHAAHWGDAVWSQVAFRTMAGGLVCALIAAVPGFIDLLSLRDAARKKVASKHMAMMLVVVVLFAVNLWLRTREAPGSALPIGLSAVAIVLMGIAGWMGAELVHRGGVGVSVEADTRTTPARPMPRPDVPPEIRHQSPQPN